jgi:hypothetical protein
VTTRAQMRERAANAPKVRIVIGTITLACVPGH